VTNAVEEDHSLFVCQSTRPVGMVSVQVESKLIDSSVKRQCSRGRQPSGPDIASAFRCIGVVEQMT
jgi:hypothetical protein